LKALQEKFGRLAKVSVVMMQAISEAEYTGVMSLDILNNIVPYIGVEEEKIK
jgi:aspartate-semialdehyde dehydrogenase